MCPRYRQNDWFVKSFHLCLQTFEDSHTYTGRLCIASPMRAGIYVGLSDSLPLTVSGDQHQDQQTDRRETTQLSQRRSRATHGQNTSIHSGIQTKWQLYWIIRFLLTTPWLPSTHSSPPPPGGHALSISGGDCVSLMGTQIASGGGAAG